MRRISKQVLVFIFLLGLLVSPSLVFADSQSTNSLKFVGEQGNNPYAAISPGRNDLAGIVGLVIQAMLGLLGVIFLIYTVYAGYNWMVAQGDEEKVTKAKETIQRAIIGLIVIIGAYAISYWVFDKLLTQTGILT
jgi:hypothetical protein